MMLSIRLQPFKTAVLVLVWGWLLFLVLAPNLLVVGASVMTRDPSTFIALPLNLDAYRQLFNPLYLDVFLHSLWMATLTTAICLLIGYPFAWALSKVQKRRQMLLIFLLIIPFWTNSLVRVYALKLILAANGLLNSALLWLGWISEPLQMLYTQGAVIIGLVYLLLPFMILPLYAVFDDLRQDVLLASHDLGAGRFATFTNVIIPLTLPGVLAGVMLVLLPAMGLFFVPDILGGSRNLLVGNVIKNQFLDARNWPFGAAASIVLTLTMALLMFAHRLSKQRLGEESS
ncbi:spermidine/putrescine ABC transporter permease PotB [Marinobacter sp. M3C]|jgi:spermidine/putrescine transport system permease protein|uniref:spermidine/putrescine ABC transporter permease PotB n=1 Tax=unclassified Marinobacter TaxID=83889 RepID=UPI00200BB483|nr:MULTISPECIES: spermidine/putrescine ABC transporter permease PotB [unclassified Marinobacter]MCL1477221.1 spermidine/putrescine ABC transporter permease PotB [Marinobacter sp.]MCL1480697.1 spermidine/putrescine ABC transporter permease PotB [Marinobacter sp.]MCL1484922.1 spermidine/putrescine ABC transporter permease PotB [Marinobacter sp.]UQG56420.1 spermidine/putrescine ABC transporter permease PotB [Marinobacter sp. M4C]UQG62383.1 spermidine/putrescine ABC transporter permease PotB [Mari